MTPDSHLRRLLVVEDSEADVELFREALGDVEPTVALEVVRDGEDALDLLHRRGRHHDAIRPDLVVLDLNLPRTSGLEVLQALREDEDPELRRLPIVVFTTSRSPSDVSTAYDLQASSFVTKPTAFEQYLAVVGSFRDFWLRHAQLPSRA